jgi:cell division protein FtsZ
MQGAGSAPSWASAPPVGDDRALQAAELAVSSPRSWRPPSTAPTACCSPSRAAATWASTRSTEAARLVQEAAHPDANIIFGAVIDDALGDEVRVTVIAAGFEGGGPTPRAETSGAVRSGGSDRGDRGLAAGGSDRGSRQEGAARAFGSSRPSPSAPSRPEPRPVRSADSASPATSGGWGAPQQSFTPSPQAPAAEPVASDPADVEEEAPQQAQPVQPAPVQPQSSPVRPPRVEEPPADDDDLDLPSFLK